MTGVANIQRTKTGGEEQTGKKQNGGYISA